MYLGTGKVTVLYRVVRVSLTEMETFDQDLKEVRKASGYMGQKHFFFFDRRGHLMKIPRVKCA